MKSWVTLSTLTGVLLVGVLIGHYLSPSRGNAPLSNLESMKPKGGDDMLSPIEFWGFYVPEKDAVELRFIGKVTLVDGVPFRNDAVESAIRSEKVRKDARNLFIVGGESDPFGSLIEAAAKFRKLGFGCVVLMADATWVNDGYHWHPIGFPTP